MIFYYYCRSWTNWCHQQPTGCTTPRYSALPPQPLWAPSYWLKDRGRRLKHSFPFPFLSYPFYFLFDQYMCVRFILCLSYSAHPQQRIRASTCIASITSLTHNNQSAWPCFEYSISLIAHPPTHITTHRHNHPPTHITHRHNHPPTHIIFQDSRRSNAERSVYTVSGWVLEQRYGTPRHAHMYM